MKLYYIKSACLGTLVALFLIVMMQYLGDLKIFDYFIFPFGRVGLWAVTTFAIIPLCNANVYYSCAGLGFDGPWAPVEYLGVLGGIIMAYAVIGIVIAFCVRKYKNRGI